MVSQTGQALSAGQVSQEANITLCEIRKHTLRTETFAFPLSHDDLGRGIVIRQDDCTHSRRSGLTSARRHWLRSRSLAEADDPPLQDVRRTGCAVSPRQWPGALRLHDVARFRHTGLRVLFAGLRVFCGLTILAACARGRHFEDVVACLPGSGRGASQESFHRRTLCDPLFACLGFAFPCRFLQREERPSLER